MAHNLVDVDTWTAAVAVPDDGDAASAISVENGMQDLADRTLYLKNRSAGADGGTIVVPIAPIDYGNPVSWTIDPDGYPTPGPGPGFLGAVNSNVGQANGVIVPLPQIYGCSFTAVSAIVHGDFWATGGHGVVLPNTMPYLVLYSVPLATGVPNGFSSTVDPSADTAAYHVVHPITGTFAAKPFDGATAYYAKVTGEFGGTASADHLVLIALTMTITP